MAIIHKTSTVVLLLFTMAVRLNDAQLACMAILFKLVDNVVRPAIMAKSASKVLVLAITAASTIELQ